MKKFRYLVLSILNMLLCQEDGCNRKVYTRGNGGQYCYNHVYCSADVSNRNIKWPSPSVNLKGTHKCTRYRIDGTKYCRAHGSKSVTDKKIDSHKESHVECDEICDSFFPNLTTDELREAILSEGGKIHGIPTRTGLENKLQELLIGKLDNKF